MYQSDFKPKNLCRAPLCLALSMYLLFTACKNDEIVNSRPITVSFETNKTSAPIGSPLEIKYHFQIDSNSAPIDQDYTIFVHFLDSYGSLLFTDDHTPPDSFSQTSAWKAGDSIEYQRTVFIPLYPYLGTAKVEIGLYIPETGERLALNEVNSTEVGTIELLDQKENIFLVYKEGWHQLETDPDNPNSGIEWQWTKKEAVCSFRNPKQDSILYIQGDTNTGAFEEPLEVSILIGETEIFTFTVNQRDPFLQKIPIPANALTEEDWVDLRIVNSQSFIPMESGISDDSRELGLRVFHLYVD